MYSKYNNYIQGINTSAMSSPFAFDKFRENTPYLSYLGESKVLYLIYFPPQLALPSKTIF